MVRSLFPAAVAAVFAVLPLRAQRNDEPLLDWKQKTYPEALARYQECLKRKPFLHHWEAREVLGSLSSPEAVPVLCKDYASVKEHAEYSRYTIAEVFGKRFAQREALDAMKALRQNHRTPGDVWLWYQSLRLQAKLEGDAEVVALATTDKSPLLRAAAILALGDAGVGDLRNAVVTNCVELPKKESDRMVLLGAMTGALFAARSRVNDEDYRAALAAYVGLLGDEVKLSHIAKVQMARHLQIILNAPAAFGDRESWLEILARGEVKTPKRTETAASPRFFGLETDGERMVYVVDMSDSMLKPIEPSAKPAGPLTGPKEKKKKGAVLDESDLPWHQIQTRWDLARENLRISLSRLTPDKEFCVVWFGREAGTLDSCKGMIKASRGNIDRVMAELDGIKASHEPDPQDPNDPVPPEGRLRGDTNLHGGLRLAFALHDKGFASTAAYVDPQALGNGCDTILLLSDGDPSTDDFVMRDKNYREGKMVRTFERGEEAPDQPEATYSGPFVSMGVPQCPTIVADVRRMNAFRRVRLHAVGLGEANMELMKRLAAIGNGQSLTVGKATTGAAAKPAGK